VLLADTLTTTPEMTSQSSVKEGKQEKEKVHYGAKKVHWKCLQENKTGQGQVQRLVRGRKGICGKNNKMIQG
jgi:hypothetical protein